MSPLRVAAQPLLVGINGFVDRSNLNGCLGIADRQVGKRIAVDAAAADVLGGALSLAVNYSHQFLRGSRIMGEAMTMRTVSPLLSVGGSGAAGGIHPNLRLLRRSSLSAPTCLHRSCSFAHLSQRTSVQVLP